MVNRRTIVPTSIRVATQTPNGNAVIRDEHAALEAAKRFRELVQDIKGAIVWEADAETLRFTFVSGSAVDILGYPVDRWLTDPKFWISHLHEEDHDAAVSARSEATSRGKDHDLEYRMIGVDGRCVWLQDKVTVVRDASGQIRQLRGFMLDVTERHQAEEVLRDGERRQREFIENLGVAIYTTDAAGRITFFNEAAAGLWGRRPELGRDEWCGSWRIYAPDGTPMPHDECPMAVTLKENRPVRGAEAMAERPDGTRVSFLPFPTPLRDASGALVGAINVLVDVTDLRRAEEAQRRAEDKYRSIFENAVFGVFQTTREGRFVSANDALAHMLGYSSAEELTSQVDDIGRQIHVDPSRRTEFARLLEENGQVLGFECEAYRKDGSVIWISLSGRTRHNGAGLGYEGIVEEITQRKRAEEALNRARNEAERRLNQERALNEISELLRTSLDLETVSEAALDSVMKVTGTEFGILAIKRAGESRIMATRGFPESFPASFDIGPRSRTLLAKALFKASSAFSPQKRLPGASPMRPMAVKRFAVVPLIARGAVVGAIELGGRTGSRWTSGERKFLRRVADHIALAIGNALAHQEVEITLRTRDEGIRAIAHEIRTPLTSIKGFAQLGLSHLDRQPPRLLRAKDALQEIDLASDRLSKFAVQMLETSSIEAGLGKLRKERLSLGPFLREAISEFASEGTPCPVRLERPAPVWLRFDPQLIRQVLWNLLSNANRYSPPGEPIVVQSVREEGRVIVSVIDRGRGVPKRERPRLFEKFVRGRTRSKDGASLGLGLYLAKQVVEAHGGRIWYEPTGSHGATFAFSLPITRGGK